MNRLLLNEPPPTKSQKSWRTFTTPNGTPLPARSSFNFIAYITQYNNVYPSYLILVIQVMRESIIEKQRMIDIIDP